MTFDAWAPAAVLAVLLVGLILYYRKRRVRLPGLLLTAAIGVASLWPAAQWLAASGRTLTVNLFTVLTAAGLGLPGVAALCAALRLWG